MNQTAPAADHLQELETLCKRICHILEREHAVLRGRNGLIGDGVGELEQLHAEKDREIDQLERMTRAFASAETTRQQSERAQQVREHIERCKNLQARNHQVFSRVVTAQRRIISLLRTPEDDISLYDKVGRTRDYGALRRAELA
jgi:flagellar biosynthesis/type III secretory pathway chaperone